MRWYANLRKEAARLCLVWHLLMWRVVQVAKVNGQPAENLAELVRLVETCESEFLSFDLEYNQVAPLWCSCGCTYTLLYTSPGLLPERAHHLQHTLVHKKQGHDRRVLCCTQWTLPRQGAAMLHSDGFDI